MARSYAPIVSGRQDARNIAAAAVFRRRIALSTCILLSSLCMLIIHHLSSLPLWTEHAGVLLILFDAGLEFASIGLWSRLQLARDA